MSHPRRLGVALLAALAAVTSLVIVASSGAAGPPLPTAANGNKVEVAGTGVPTPTAFAFTGSTVFAGSGPDESTGGPGGLYTVADGTATKIPNTPAIVFGLAWKSNKLYVSTGPTIVALSGWNGTTFSSSKTIYQNKKKGFPGFNGLAFGPEGRLYSGLSLDEKYDHSKDPFNPSQALVSMTATPRQLEVLALMAEGRSNGAIAERLTLTTKAVVRHVSHIYDTLGLEPADEDHRRVLAVVRYLSD